MNTIQYNTIQSVGRTFLLIRVAGYEMYSGICGCRLSVYVCFYVRAVSVEYDVENIDVSV